MVAELHLVDCQVENPIGLAPSGVAVRQERPFHHLMSYLSVQELMLRPETEHRLLQVKAMLDSAVCS